MMMIGRRLRRMRLLLAVFAVTGVLSLLGVVVFMVGHSSASVLVLLLSTQVLIAGSAVVLHRAVFRSRGRGAEETAEESAPFSLDDVVEGVRTELATLTRNEELLGRLLQSQAAARDELRRDLFEEAFSEQERPGSATAGSRGQD